MKKPNIIFIFTDQQHWHAAGYMDPFYTTPVLDALAADGTVFTRAYCSTPQCSPSRSTMMTGSYPHKTGVMGNIGASGGAGCRSRGIIPGISVNGTSAKIRQGRPAGIRITVLPARIFITTACIPICLWISYTTWQT